MKITKDKIIVMLIALIGVLSIVGFVVLNMFMHNLQKQEDIQELNMSRRYLHLQKSQDRLQEALETTQKAIQENDAKMQNEINELKK